MKIYGYTSLIYANYGYFFSSENTEPFWTYQNFSSWEDVHVHCPPIYGRSVKWRNSEEKQLMKWMGVFQVGIFWVGIFRGEFSRGEFDGWEFSRGEFS